jgi:hypothetical protein
MKTKKGRIDFSVPRIYIVCSLFLSCEGERGKGFVS